MPPRTSVRHRVRAGTCLTTVGLPEAQHHDVRLCVPRQPQGAGLAAVVEENLTTSGKATTSACSMSRQSFAGWRVEQTLGATADPAGALSAPT